MSAVAAIAARELRSLLCSPLAWSVLAVLEAVAGYVLVLRLDLYLEWQPRLGALGGAPGVTALVLAPVLQAIAGVLLMVVPVLTMRQLAGERRQGTLVLLLSAPIGSGGVIAGKFAGVLAFLLLGLALSTVLPLSLIGAARLDLGHLAAGYLGLVLAAALFAAVGLLASACTAQPAAAAITGIGALVLLWMVDRAAPGREAIAAHLSIAEHLEPLLRGLVDSADLAYFVIVTAACLALATRRLEALRLRG